MPTIHYILKDGSLYRVLDSVYYQQNDAKTARDAFKAQQADAACLFNVQTAGIQWNVSGSRAQIDAIKAAMNPTPGPWLYFVAVNLKTGETVFSTTAAEHDAAVKQWQAWCRQSAENMAYCS